MFCLSYFIIISLWRYERIIKLTSSVQNQRWYLLFWNSLVTTRSNTNQISSIIKGHSHSLLCDKHCLGWSFYAPEIKFRNIPKKKTKKKTVSFPSSNSACTHQPKGATWVFKKSSSATRPPEFFWMGTKKKKKGLNLKQIYCWQCTNIWQGDYFPGFPQTEHIRKRLQRLHIVCDSTMPAEASVCWAEDKQHRR